MRDLSGWVKTHRTILDWEHYKNNNVKSLSLHLVLIANYDDRQTKSGITISRGQVLTSLRSLSGELGISIKSVRTALSALQKSGEITVDTQHQSTIITLVKYADSQVDNSILRGTQSGTQSGTESGTQSGTQINPVNGMGSEALRELPTQSGTQSGTESGTESGTQSGTIIRSIRSIRNKEIKNNNTVVVSTPEVVSTERENLKSFNQGSKITSINTPPEGEEKEKVAPKRKRMLLATAKRLPITKENTYINAAIYFYKLLKPFHEGKYAFDNADTYKWAADIKIIVERHKRDIHELFDLVKWATKNAEDSFIFMQSPNFFKNKLGTNYDILLGKKKAYEKKIAQMNGEVTVKIKAPKFYK